MATIINALYLENFFNFYGDYEQNYYEFNPGLNLIIADNGNGKSKLFSAFSWILKNQVVDSDNELHKVVQVETFMAKMISDKAKSETMLNSDVRCGVKINFSDDRFEYEVEKCFYGRRIKEGSPTDENNWHCDPEEARVSRKDKVLLDFRPVSDTEEKKKIINKLIRQEFLQYALLQGEEVDHILNFNDKNSLKAAVDTLTNIKKVEQLIDLTEYLSKSAEADLLDAKRKSTKSISDFNAKVAARDSTKLKLERKQAELVRYQEELAKAKNERDDLINLLLNARQREELRSTRASIKRDLEKANEDHGQFLNHLNNNFFDNQRAWIFYNTQHYEEAFNKFRDHYIESRQARKVKEELNSQPAFLTKLPAESPDSYSLKRMLIDEKCFVCGHSAVTNSPEWLHISQLLEHHAPKPAQAARQTFTELLDILMRSASSFSNQVKIISEDLTKSRLVDKNYRQLKQKLQADMDDKQNELIGLGDIKSDVDQSTVSSYGGAERRINKYEREIKTTIDEISAYVKQLAYENSEIDKLSSKQSYAAYQARRDMVEDIKVIAASTKRRIYNQILKNLEDKSNYYYKAMTKTNSGDGGIIRIAGNVDDTFTVDLVDAENNKMYGLSEGFQRMKKLAVITAIIASSDRGMLEYPLIADAPLSSFGKGFIQGFFEKVPEVFHQSIIMVKDLFDQESSNLLTEIGNEVLNKIKVTSGSLHLNQITLGAQVSRETVIRRY